MSLVAAQGNNGSGGFPRTRGDEPSRTGDVRHDGEFSPHARG